MTNKEAVLMIEPTAKFNIWGGKNDLTGWVLAPSATPHIAAWETKICANEERAWALAVELLATRKVAA